MEKQELMAMLTAKLDEVFYTVQQREGITDGGVDPMDALALDDLTEKAADLILRVVEYQKRA